MLWILILGLLAFGHKFWIFKDILLCIRFAYSIYEACSNENKVNEPLTLTFMLKIAYSYFVAQTYLLIAWFVTFTETDRDIE